jgi:hypothetical protein
MWWWIGAGLLLWVIVSIAVALLIGRIVSHRDLEDAAETLRRNEHLRSGDRDSGPDSEPPHDLRGVPIR